MYFLVPFGIFTLSVIIMAWVIGRKFVYLKKLTPEVVESVVPEQESFLVEFFPGLAPYFSKTNLRQYRLNILAEFEKALRKMRLLSLKLDSATNHLINSVRKSVVHHESVISSEAIAQAEQGTRVFNGYNGNGQAKDWKEEEHKLILEIAKSPKNAGLYKKLGNIYMKTEEWYDAAESFKRATELDPEDETIRNKLERATKKLDPERSKKL